MIPFRFLALVAALAAAAPLVASGATGVSDPLHRDELPKIGKVRFASDHHARFPFDLRNQHLWVRGTVNGSDSIWIVIDTGAGGSVLDESVAKRLGMELRGEHQAHGAGGSQLGHMVDHLTFQLPGVSIDREHVDTIDLGALGAARGGRPMEAILGYEFFRSCVVRFDYPAGVIDVWDAKHAPKNLAGVEVPMKVHENHPYIEGELRIAGVRPIRGEFVIDSGSSQGILVAPEVVERESLEARVSPTMEVMGRGVGGEQRLSIGRADGFAIGGLMFENPLIALYRPGAGRISLPGSIGNIGGQILSRCRVTFDYGRRRVLFEPGPDFAKRWDSDMSGATFERTGPNLEVRIVNPGTPAAEAGLAVGDRVLTVDGRPVEEIDPPALRKLLQQEGRTVRLDVVRQDGREGMTMTKTLVLRRLL